MPGVGELILDVLSENGCCGESAWPRLYLEQNVLRRPRHRIAYEVGKDQPVPRQLYRISELKSPINRAASTLSERGVRNSTVKQGLRVSRSRLGREVGGIR